MCVEAWLCEIRSHIYMKSPLAHAQQYCYHLSVLPLQICHLCFLFPLHMSSLLEHGIRPHSLVHAISLNTTVNDKTGFSTFFDEARVDMLVSFIPIIGYSEYKHIRYGYGANFTLQFTVTDIASMKCCDIYVILTKCMVSLITSPTTNV